MEGDDEADTIQRSRKIKLKRLRGGKMRGERKIEGKQIRIKVNEKKI